MSNKTGFFEEAIETGVSTIKQTGKVAAQAVSDTAQSAGSQVGLPAASDQTAEDFVKDLYGSGKKPFQDDTNSQQNPQAAQIKTQDDAVSEKSPEEQQKMQVLRSKLHQELHNEVYYDPLVNPKGDKPEERPTEKIENEKQEEMVDLQEKKKKELPILVQRNQQKTEKFPGGGG